MDDNDAQNFVDLSKVHLQNDDIEYLQTRLDESSALLKSIRWTFSGSRDVVSRCNDLMFWDSTHHVARYNYKLSTFTAVHSEGKSRAVLISLNLSETTVDSIDCIQSSKIHSGYPYREWWLAMTTIRLNRR